MDTNQVLENFKKKWWAVAILLVVGVLGYKYAPLFHDEDTVGILKTVEADPSLSFSQKLDRFSEIRRAAMPLSGKPKTAGVSTEDKDSIVIIQSDLLGKQVASLDDLKLPCQERSTMAKLIIDYCDTLKLYKKNTNELTRIKREAETQFNLINKQIASLEKINKGFEKADSDISLLSQSLLNHQRTYAESIENEELVAKFKTWLSDAGELNHRTLPTVNIAGASQRFKTWFDLLNQWNKDEEIKGIAAGQLDDIIPKQDELLNAQHPESILKKQIEDLAKNRMKNLATSKRFSTQEVDLNSPKEDVVNKKEEGGKIITLTFEGTGKIKYSGVTTSEYRVNGSGKIIRNYFEGKDTIETLDVDCEEDK